MSITAIDIRQSADQSAELTRLIIKALPDDDEKQSQFLIAGKWHSKDCFALDMFAHANITNEDFTQRILCSLSDFTLSRLFNSERFRLDTREFYPTENPNFFYIVTYFK